LKWIDDVANGWGSGEHNRNFRMFEVGDEIKLKKMVVEEQVETVMTEKIARYSEDNP
jgi:hypothetical protein